MGAVRRGVAEGGTRVGGAAGVETSKVGSKAGDAGLSDLQAASKSNAAMKPRSKGVRRTVESGEMVHPR